MSDINSVLQYALSEYFERIKGIYEFEFESGRFEY